MNSDSDHCYAPGPSERTVLALDGRVLTVPDGWVLLPPGDAALTRRVKAAGDCWTVQEKIRRKIFSRGVWAPGETIERIRTELVEERSSVKYKKRKEADASRREKSQATYVDDFFENVLAYLNFHPRYFELEERLARAVVDHATPVGSGTVARTKRIPIEDRAELAVLAWMRHNTTDYETRSIPRVRGKRREVRRMLAKSSIQLLDRYRRGDVKSEGPLELALSMVSEDKSIT